MSDDTRHAAEVGEAVMSAVELLPCPFCGGPARRGAYDIWCDGTQFNRHTMIVLRLQEWNARTPDARAAALEEAAMAVDSLARLSEEEIRQKTSAQIMDCIHDVLRSRQVRKAAAAIRALITKETTNGL